MARQDWLRKWCTYALALLPIWLLDDFVLSRWTFLGISPILLPVAVTAVSTLEGVSGGAGFGLGAGLLWTAAYPGGNSLRVLALTLVGLLTGALAQHVLSQNFLGCFMGAVAALGVLEGLTVLSAVVTDRAPAMALLQIAGLQILWSLCWMPLIYAIFYRVFRRVGGDRLA